MRWLLTLREALATTWAAKVPSALVTSKKRSDRPGESPAALSGVATVIVAVRAMPEV